MNQDELIRIFLSYARKDGSELARRLQEDLNAQGFEAWLDKRRIAGGASWTEEIEQALDAAAFFLAIMTRGSYESEICRAEQLRALRKGKLVIPLLGQSDRNVVPLHLETRNYRDLTADYAAAFKDLLEDLANRRSLMTVPARYRETAYNTVPPLPVNYVERPRELRGLRDVLITDGEGRHIALTALRGMGGIGKSVLAQALCHDPVVQQAFPDGIVWVTVGRDPCTDTLTWLREAGKALGDDLSHYENRTAAQSRFRSIVLDRAVLIVLDDVWDAAWIDPFLADSPRSRMLITTRDATIAAGAGATEHIADLLSEADARVVLARWSGLSAERLPAEAAALIEESGRLPLALAMIGAMLRGKPEKYWNRVLSLLREADLAKIRAQFPGYPHHDLFRAMEVGVAAVDETVRARYLRLAVTLEDMVIAPAVQCALWGVDEGEAFDTAEALIGLSLAERSGEDGAIRLHDLQLDYLRAQWPDRTALELIHGALRLSMHVVGKDPKQFASQLVGRLLAYCDRPAIAEFLNEIAAAAPRPWLRPTLVWLDTPGGPLLRTLENHTYATSVAITPDGSKVVSGSTDNKVKVWDPKTGQLLHALEGHSDWVVGVAISADGRLAFSASWDSTVRIWDVNTGRELHKLEGHSGVTSAVAVTLDGSLLVSASWDKTLKVWEVKTGNLVCTLQGHSDAVTGVALTPDGKRAVSASRDQTLKVWNLETGCLLCTLEGHSDVVNGVALAPDGKIAISASRDQTLILWDSETRQALYTMAAHTGPVESVALSADGKRAVSASSDKTLILWDLDTGRALHTVEGHSGPIMGVALTANGKRAISASRDWTLKIWDLERSSGRSVAQGHLDRVKAVATSRDGKRAVSASGDWTLKVWDVENGRAVRTLKGHSDAVQDVAITADGLWAVSGSRDRTIRLWDLENGRMIRTLDGHSGAVNGVAVTTDGRLLVSGSSDKTLKVWNPESGQVLRTLEGHFDDVECVAVAPDNKIAVSASRDRTLKVWNLETGETLRTLEGHTDSALCVAITPDGKHAVSGSKDKTVRVWDLATGREIQTIQSHSSWVSSMSFTSDRRHVVTASWDQTLLVSDLESGVVAAFSCDAELLCCASAKPNVLVAGDINGRVHFLVFEGQPR